MRTYGIAALALFVTALTALSLALCWAVAQAAVWMATVAVVVQ